MNPADERFLIRFLSRNEKEKFNIIQFKVGDGPPSCALWNIVYETGGESLARREHPTRIWQRL